MENENIQTNSTENIVSTETIENVDTTNSENIENTADVITSDGKVVDEIEEVAENAETTPIPTPTPTPLFSISLPDGTTLNQYKGHDVFYTADGKAFFFDEKGERVFISDPDNIAINDGSVLNSDPETEEIAKIPFMEKPINEYGTVESLLLLLFISVLTLIGILFVR